MHSFLYFLLYKRPKRCHRKTSAVEVSSTLFFISFLFDGSVISKLYRRYRRVCRKKNRICKNAEIQCHKQRFQTTTRSQHNKIPWNCDLWNHVLIYFVCGAVIGIYNYEFTFLAFHVLLSIGYAMLIKISITEYFSSSFSSINW